MELTKQDEMLLKVYIGQKINFDRGILYQFKTKNLFNNQENKIIEDLVQTKYIEEIYPYSRVRSIRTLVSTQKGIDTSNILINKILHNNHHLNDELESIPKKVLGFFLINLNYNIFEKTKIQFFYNWKKFILGNQRIFDLSIIFCQILLNHRLAVLTNPYVSTKGGRIDPKRYVISDEIREYIITNLKPIPFNDVEITRAILIRTLYTIANDILPINNEAKRRNAFWNLLQVLPFDEFAIKKVINVFAKENITTKYSEFDNDQFLFQILNNSRFFEKLNELRDKFISEIIKGETKETQISLRKTNDLLKIHSNLFIVIGIFEINFRYYILNEMKLAFRDDEKEWYYRLKEIKIGDNLAYKTIYEKLKFRENEDIKNKSLPEDELIYYADIIDYMNIILKYWSVFKNKFTKIGLNKEKFEHGMNQVNKIRRKVMHLRDVRTYEAKTFRLYILPELEKIFL